MLALIYREPGHEQVLAALSGAWVSTVNWAEVVANSSNATTGIPVPPPRPSAHSVEVVAFTPPLVLPTAPKRIKRPGE